MAISLERVGVALDREERNKQNRNLEKIEVAIGEVGNAVPEAKAARLLSEEAKAQAIAAEEQALAAEERAAGVQTQLDEIVVNGDSSVEAAQARLSVDGTAYVNLKDRLDKEHQEVTVKLAETLKKGQVSVSDIDKNKGLLDQTYLSDSLKQQIAGTAPINATPADGSLTAAKFSSGAVTPPKLDTELVKPTNLNLYNKYTAKRTTFISDGVTESYNANITATDFIPVKAKTPYIVTQVRGTSIFYYNAAKEVIGNVTVGSTVVLNHQIITPANAAFIRINIYIGYEEMYMVIEGSQMPSEFIPHYSFNENMVSIKNGSVDIHKLSANIVSEGKVNLYNKVRTIPKFVMNASTGELIANASYSVSDFIPVEANTKYIVTALRGTGAFHYDANMVLLGTNNAGASTIEGFTFTTPANTAFTRLNIYTGYEDNFMMVKGEALPPSFVSFYKLSPLLPVHYKDVIGAPQANRLSGKTLWTFGDSITWYDGKPFQSTHQSNGITAIGYQSYIRLATNMNVVNKGLNGYRLRQIVDAILLENFTGVDYVSLTSGANDWSQNYPIGELMPPKSAFTFSSFYGALQQAVEHLITNYPDLKIILVTPARGYHPVSEHPAPHPQGVVIGDMMEMPDVFAKAFKDVAKLYGLPLVDFRDGSQINFINYKTMLTDDPLQTGGKYVHPNNKAYKLMGDVIVGEMKKLM